MKKPTAAVFCMESPGHFQRLRAIVSGLSARGVDTHVFTHRSLQGLVEEDGGVFSDLFARHSVDDADAESIPRGCRSVSFAGLHADEIIEDVRGLDPELIVHDAFAVIGPVVAAALGRPAVNLCVGHNVSPESYREALKTFPKSSISPRCLDAVARLRTRYGMPDADPYSFLHLSSASLNIYCEPPEFLTAAERASFEPVAFVGSLAPSQLSREPGPRVSSEGRAKGERSVYVSLGTVVWKHFPDAALETIRTLARALGSIPDVRALISLGGRMDPSEVGVEAPNVTVERYVDQWDVLREADVFFTHHGLKSTHEAIYHRVPMVSCPFFTDQPGMARRCQELGLAIPLTTTRRDPVTVAGVHSALQAVHDNRAAMASRLALAREWELRVIEGRSGVLDRLAAMCEVRSG